MDQDRSKNKWTIQSITLWIYKNFTSILIVLALFIITLIIKGGLSEWEKKKNNKSYGHLYQMKKSLQLAGEKANGDKYRSQNFNSFFKQSKSKNSVYSDDMKSLAEKYENSIRQHEKEKVGAVFAIDLANFYYLHKETNRAQSLLSLFAFPNKKSDIYHLVSFQLANYYMIDENCEQAIPLWTALINNKKAIAFYGDASLQLALCQEKNKNYTEANDIYEKLIQKSSNDFEKKKFQEYKQLLVLKKKLGTQ